MRQLVGAVRAIASDIKIAHSVFALPFALLASVMAARPLGGVVVAVRLDVHTAGLVVVRVHDVEGAAARPELQGEDDVDVGAPGLRAEAADDAERDQDAQHGGQ